MYNRYRIVAENSVETCLLGHSEIQMQFRPGPRWGSLARPKPPTDPLVDGESPSPFPTPSTWRLVLDADAFCTDRDWPARFSDASAAYVNVPFNTNYRLYRGHGLGWRYSSTRLRMANDTEITQPGCLFVQR